MLRNLKNQNHQSYTEDITLSYELQFLIACCQVEPNLKEILSLSLKIKNWEKLISMASRHGILPLVYKTLKIKELAIDTEVLRELKNRYLNISKKNMLMSAELICIMKLLTDHNIKALAFKGPTLSQMIYGDITLRQYGDLDILVNEEDIYKIDNLLKKQNYERFLVLTSIQESIWIKYAHDIGLIHKQKKIHLEIHWSFLDRDYPMQITLNDFWKENQTIKINKYLISTFSDENILYYLCIHGSKHLWERIEWIKDIDLIIRKKNIDWEKIIRKSKKTDFEKMFYLGLYLSALVFNTPLPQNIQKEITNNKILNKISITILQNWEIEKSSFSKTITMLKLFPNIKKKIIYLHKTILKPSFNEYCYVNLPKKMYWGYYLIRPYLLIKKYI